MFDRSDSTRLDENTMKNLKVIRDSLKVLCDHGRDPISHITGADKNLRQKIQQLSPLVYDDSLKKDAPKRKSGSNKGKSGANKRKKNEERSRCS